MRTSLESAVLLGKGLGMLEDFVFELGAADEDVRDEGVLIIEADFGAVEAAAVQAGRLGDAHRSRLIPLVLAAGVDVGVDVAEQYVHGLGAGGAHVDLSLIHISEPTRLSLVSRMPSSA